VPHRPVRRDPGHRHPRGLRALATAAAGIAACGLVLSAGTLPSAGTVRTDPAAATASATHSQVTLVRDGSGRVRLLAASGVRVAGLPPGSSASTAARAQLARVGKVFGVAARDLRTTGLSRVAGRDVVRFQQTRDGLPVLGGQLVAVLDGRGGLLSVSGETARASSGDLATSYDVDASVAARTARRAVAAAHRERLGSLVAERPTRWLLDRSLLEAGGTPGLRAVWRVPVRSTARADLRDVVLVDARTGAVAMRLSDIEPLDRVVCDDVRTRSFHCRSNGYDRVEGGPASGIADADQAFDLTGATATWYADTLGVDLTALIGDDQGDGRKLRSTTNYCPPGSCPLDNAFWSGDQMVYGAGYTSADDVVAHELTHGVTQHTAGLVYWYQSGAINESMSDVFGELVDLGDGVGDDAPELRWRLGEDLPGSAGGATRDMADPPRFSQPDTTSSPLYDYAADYDDSGGVHTDSGVPNKTAYLITDGTAAEPGGAFQGRAFAGIGTARAATLYWATLQMLTPGADFVDLAAALRQACANLGYSAAECATVDAAVGATGLNRWTGPGPPRLVSMSGGPGQVHLEWSPPASTGTAALGSYVVSVSPAVHGEDFFTVEPSAEDYLLQDLAPGVDYVVRLVAVSPHGTSPAVSRIFSGSAFTVSAPSSAAWGHRVRVTGALRNVPGAGLGGRRVRLMRRDVGSSAYRETDSTITAADGTFTFRWPARAGTQWYVLYRGARTELGVRGAHHVTVVRSRVSVTVDETAPDAGSRVTVAGAVRPARRAGHAGGVVTLQRREPDGDWARVAQATVTAGRYSLTWHVPTTRETALRVRVPAHPDAGLAAGTSRVLTLNRH
jgi:bacillolysin